MNWIQEIFVIFFNRDNLIVGRGLMFSVLKGKLWHILQIRENLPERQLLPLQNTRIRYGENLL